MLSDEEKQSIESLKNIAIYIGDNYTFSQQGIRNLRENLRIVLPVIEKQAKEIEECKKQLDLDNECEIALNSKVMDLEKEIEELKEKNRQSKMRIVQLENEITARIEDVNQYYTPNDKIKAKIEELEKELEDIQLKNINKDEISRTDFYFIEKLRNKIDVLQSLLEKE